MTCPVCDKQFWRHASQVKWRGGRYCSRSCHNAGSRTSQTISCVQCGGTRSVQPWALADGRRGKFCSLACYRTWQRETRTHIVTLTCVTCGAEFQRPQAWVRQGAGKACSRACAATARERGPALPRRGRLWKEVCVTVKDRDGNTCVRCGATGGDTPSTRLHVDHIVAARLLIHRPDLADHPDNLASLCPSCHGIKTGIERRVLKGDLLAIQEFYGRDLMLAARKRLTDAAS